MTKQATLRKMAQLLVRREMQKQAYVNEMRKRAYAQEMYKRAYAQELYKQAQGFDWAEPSPAMAMGALEKYVNNTLGDDEFGPYTNRMLSNLGEDVRSDSLANEFFNNIYNLATDNQSLPASTFVDSLMNMADHANMDNYGIGDWYGIPSDQRNAMIDLVSAHTAPDVLVPNSDSVGVPPPAWSAWEKPTRKPGFKTTPELDNVSPGWLKLLEDQDLDSEPDRSLYSNL